MYVLLFGFRQSFGVIINGDSPCVLNSVCPANTYSSARSASCTGCPSGSNSTSSVGAPPTTCSCSSGYATNGQTGGLLACTGTHVTCSWKHADTTRRAWPLTFLSERIPLRTGEQHALLGSMLPSAILSAPVRVSANRSTHCCRDVPKLASAVACADCRKGSYSGALANTCTTCQANSGSTDAASTCTCLDGYASNGTTGASLVCSGTI